MPDIQHAYDLLTLDRGVSRLGLEADHGWVFGLPRGISTQQWPLDPITGAPLMHGFTLLLPSDYRCHGPDIIGLAFFATAADQNDGGARPLDAELERCILTPGSQPPQQEVLRPYWDQARQAHPRLHRLTDILGYHYALILLTEEELQGATTMPPSLKSVNGTTPEWITKGSLAAYSSYVGKPPLNPLDALKQQFSQPDHEQGISILERHHAVRWSTRDDDPNAGIKPEESWGESSSSGYIAPHDPENNYELRPWVESLGLNHIGGTMQPIQAVPDMSPWYIGFEEDFGGYNFGGGNAQLDFRDMAFDWACG